MRAKSRADEVKAKRSHQRGKRAERKTQVDHQKKQRTSKVHLRRFVQEIQRRENKPHGRNKSALIKVAAELFSLSLLNE